jgi:uncharacterized membrane protein YqjE
MKRASHPNFILGLISFLLLIIGVGMRSNGLASANYVLIASFVLGGIHWIWAIVEVLKNFRTDSTRENRILWVIAVIAVPPVGGMLYYLFGRTVTI